MKERIRRRRYSRPPRGGDARSQLLFAAAKMGVYLLGADADWLFADNPGDALQQRGRGQGAVVRPVVQATGEQGGGVEVVEGGLLAL